MLKIKYYGFIIISLVIAACNAPVENNTSDSTAKKTTKEGYYGKEISPEKAEPVETIIDLLKENDTVDIKLTGTITACCQHSGCWMDVDLGNGETVKVTFKENAFFIPKDAAGKKTTFEGVAFRELVDVETLRHYAEDEGKSQEEIDAITEPEYFYSFVAEGVIIE